MRSFIQFFLEKGAGIAHNKNMNPLKNIGRLIAPFPGEWVTLALDKQKVVGHSKRMEAALKQAYKKGIKNPFLIKAPDGSTAAFIY